MAASPRRPCSFAYVITFLSVLKDSSFLLFRSGAPSCKHNPCVRGILKIMSFTDSDMELSALFAVKIFRNINRQQMTPVYRAAIIWQRNSSYENGIPNVKQNLEGIIRKKIFAIW